MSGHAGGAGDAATAGDGSRATPGNRGGRQLLLLLGIATLATLALFRGAVMLAPELLPPTDLCEVAGVARAAGVAGVATEQSAEKATNAATTNETNGEPTQSTPRLHVLQRWPFHDYRCPLHSMTGIACPTCGGTRALVSLVRGDPARSLRWNPLVILCALGLPLLGVFAVLAPARYDALASWTGGWLRTWPGRLLLIAAVIAQMAYGTLFLAWIAAGGVSGGGA